MRRTTLMFAFACLVGALVATPVAGYASHQFTDVPDSHVFHDAIDWLADSGITNGCNPPLNTMFCPDDAVTRGQMAAFLVRALGYSDDGGGNLFADDDDSIFEADIDKLRTAGVTQGCNPPANTNYCPNNNVTRGQMAAFLVRALNLTDTGTGNFFTDDDTSVFELDIDKLAAAGVTRGCNPPINDKFCPDDFVTRGQMAGFLRRALAPALICDRASVPEECVALIALYEATSGDDWIRNDSWFAGSNVCAWQGVHCEFGRVIWLDLPYNRLSGSIPAEIGNLTNLQRLWLYNNQLTGAIPAEIGNLTNLEFLELNNNQLTGAIPAEIGNLTNLQYLFLSDNQLTGSIPPEIGNLNNLEGLWLFNNQLTGSIPPEIGNLTNLRDLYLENNDLSGEVPTELQTGTNITSSLTLRGQKGCLYTNDAGFEEWLISLDPLWDDGCPA